MTGAVGMLLLFTYLIEATNSLQPDLTRHYSLRLRHDRHRSADGGRMTDNARKVAGDLAMMDAINNGEDVKR